MSTGVMTEWTGAELLRRSARITGVVYLLYFVAAILGQTITNLGLVVLGNAITLLR